MQEKPNGL